VIEGLVAVLGSPAHSPQECRSPDDPTLQFAGPGRCSRDRYRVNAKSREERARRTRRLALHGHEVQSHFAGFGGKGTTGGKPLVSSAGGA